MRLRTELALGVAVLLVLAVLAAGLGQRSNRAPSQDFRRSTYLAGPHGARAVADGLRRLGVQVKQYRRRSRELINLETPPDRYAFAVLDPSESIRPGELDDFLELGERVDLVLAGPGAARLMRCFGYAYQAQYGDSVQAIEPGTPVSGRSPWVEAVLGASTVQVVTDSSGLADASLAACGVPTMAFAETLLVTRTGRVEAIRLHRADVDHRVTLVADGHLFSNNDLRNTEAGPFALGLFAGRYDAVMFEESHHGFAASGSLASAALRWSKRSPWGWAAWQLALVGLIALLFGAVRFGAPRPAIPRKRRSPLEHVRALATALAAAHGHDVAVATILRGLRRRLSPGGQSDQRPDKEWLDALEQTAESPRAQAAVQTLKQVTRPGQPVSGVLLAANAVEDVWEELGR
jgi:hypothetical protein